jgi:hypothetical protein
MLQALLAIIPLQLMAYAIARKRGLNVDQPRNLAKTVTGRVDRRVLRWLHGNDRGSFRDVQDRRGPRGHPPRLRCHAHHRRGHLGPPADHDKAIAVLKRLPELGVDLIDTAESYGPYVSEELIAEALHPYDGLTIATKAASCAPVRGPGPSAGAPTSCARAAR